MNDDGASCVTVSHTCTERATGWVAAARAWLRTKRLGAGRGFSAAAGATAAACSAAIAVRCDGKKNTGVDFIHIIPILDLKMNKVWISIANIKLQSRISYGILVSSLYKYSTRTYQ